MRPLLALEARMLPTRGSSVWCECVRALSSKLYRRSSLVVFLLCLIQLNRLLHPIPLICVESNSSFPFPSISRTYLGSRGHVLILQDLAIGPDWVHMSEPMCSVCISKNKPNNLHKLIVSFYNQLLISLSNQLHMSSNARRALKLLLTRSYNLGIEVASWYQNVTNLKTCKVCNEGMVEDECHLLFTYSTYSAIRSRYADIPGGSDNLSVILKTPLRRLNLYVYALLTHRDFVLQCMNTPSQEGDAYQEYMYTLVPQVKFGLFMDDKNYFVSDPGGPALIRHACADQCDIPHTIKHVGEVPINHVRQRGKLMNVLHVSTITKNLELIESNC